MIATEPRVTKTEFKPQLASCVSCGRFFKLVTALQALAWHRRGERCPKCGGAT